MALLFRSSVDAEARWKPQLKGLGSEVALWGPVSKNREGAAGLRRHSCRRRLRRKDYLNTNFLIQASRDGDRPIAGSAPAEDLYG